MMAETKSFVDITPSTVPLPKPATGRLGALDDQPTVAIRSITSGSSTAVGSPI